MAAKQLDGTGQQWAELNARFGGNGLALKFSFSLTPNSVPSLRLPSGSSTRRFVFARNMAWRWLRLKS